MASNINLANPFPNFSSVNESSLHGVDPFRFTQVQTRGNARTKTNGITKESLENKILGIFEHEGNQRLDPVVSHLRRMAGATYNAENVVAEGEYCPSQIDACEEISKQANEPKYQIKAQLVPHRPDLRLFKREAQEQRERAAADARGAEVRKLATKKEDHELFIPEDRPDNLDDLDILDDPDILGDLDNLDDLNNLGNLDNLDVRDPFSPDIDDPNRPLKLRPVGQKKPSGKRTSKKHNLAPKPEPELEPAPKQSRLDKGDACNMSESDDD